MQGVLDSSGLKLTPSFFAQKDTTIGNFERQRTENQFRYNPKNWKFRDTIYRPFIPSDSLFIKLLSEATNTKVSFAKGNDSLDWKALHTGNEKLLYKGLLHDSDNGIAEALLLMIANQQKGVFKTEVAIDSLIDKWKPWLPDKLEWVDGSGVSRYNMITPRTIVSILQKIDCKLPWEKIKLLFPKSGVSGTLKAYKDLENLYAKKGSSWKYRNKTFDDLTFVPARDTQWTSASSDHAAGSTMIYNNVTGGGTWYKDYYGTQSFDYESVDIRMDVTPVINYIMSGTVPNDGLILMHSGSQETDNIEYVDYKAIQKSMQTFRKELAEEEERKNAKQN